jgi:hypothetical protein
MNTDNKNRKSLNVSGLRNRSRIDRSSKEIAENFIQIYLLKGTELLLLHLHNPFRNMVAPELLTELDPGERVTVLSRVGLPPVKSLVSQLPCCVKDSLPIVALRNTQLALHRT